MRRDGNVPLVPGRLGTCKNCNGGTEGGIGASLVEGESTDDISQNETQEK